MGVLEKIDGGRTKRLWKRKLVNKVSPLEAIVTDDGTYTITFDNWFGVGKDPVVIYDNRGKIVKRHTLESLDLIKYTKGRKVDENTWTTEGLITRSISSVYWRNDALTILSEDQKRLIVRTHWGHLVVVDLKSGKLLQKEEYAADIEHIRKYAKKAIEKLLYSERGGDRRKGSVLAGSMGDSEYEERLKDLLDDPEFYTGHTSQGREYKSSFRKYYVREAAKSALEKLGVKVEGVVLREEYMSDEDRQKVIELNSKWKSNQSVDTTSTDAAVVSP